MPPLFEGSSLYMPTALPGIAIEQAKVLLQKQDAILRTFPEVASVFGAVGRSDSATDNAPLDMYDTTIMLKPREQWRPGMTYEKLIQEMDAKVQFPGLSNTWTMPVENRLDMELTGIKTPLGLKVQGPERGRHRATRLADATRPLRDAAGAVDLRGTYLAGLLRQRGSKPQEAARYGLSVADIQTAVASGIGGAEHRREHRRARTLSHQCALLAGFPRQRGANAQRLDCNSIRRQIPLGQVARISFSHGPAMIRDEDGQLTGYVYIDLKPPTTAASWMRQPASCTIRLHCRPN